MSCELSYIESKYGAYLTLFEGELKMIPMTYQESMMSDEEYLRNEIQKLTEKIIAKHCNIL